MHVRYIVYIRDIADGNDEIEQQSVVKYTSVKCREQERKDCLGQVQFSLHHSRLMTFFILLSILFLSCFPSPHHACNQLDRDSLMSFYHNFISSDSLNWSVTDCCLWEGIACNRHGRISYLRLPLRGLRGDISPSLLNLTHLSYLNLSYNSLSGPIPDGFFSSLKRLKILDLSFNNLSGNLPSSLSSNGFSSSIQSIDLSSNNFEGKVQSSFLEQTWNLTNFNVSNNSFVGPFPSSICTTSPLVTVLDLSDNYFSGHIPHGLGECSKLEIFRAGFNYLSGEVPNDIYKAAALREISLPFNVITGHIDDGVVHLTNLTVLDLYKNELSGTLPLEIGRLLHLEWLLLHSNYLNGSIPPSLMNCTNLKTLNLGANLFSGDISVLDFSNLLQLSTLDLGNNYLTGKLPFSLYSCKSLTAVRLSNNQLEGQITPDMLALQSLSYLSLSSSRITNINGAFMILMGLKNLKVVILNNNFFNEILPTDEVMGNLDGFQNLWVLALSGCQLRGQVPYWLAKLNQLEVLDLSTNRITGSIPYGLGTLSSLFFINMSNNLISGEFPKELTKVQMAPLKFDTLHNCYAEILHFNESNNTAPQKYNDFVYLPSAICLRNNSLSGRIPNEIGQLKLLSILDISLNKFSGNIPDQISNLTSLERMDLSGNQLSGKIPASLGELSSLQQFSVADNNLQGPIPLGNQLDTFPSSSFAGNPGLCGRVLLRECLETTTYGESQKNDIKEDFCFVVSIVFGFIVGFWGVCGTLFLNSSWRFAYFLFLSNVYDWIYVIIAVNVARLKRWLQS